jgi:hypothetical protein
MNNSFFGAILLILTALFLIIKFNRNLNSQKYKIKPKDKWHMFSEGKDPTDDKI